LSGGHGSGQWAWPWRALSGGGAIAWSTSCRIGEREEQIKVLCRTSIKASPQLWHSFYQVVAPALSNAGGSRKHTLAGHRASSSGRAERPWLFCAARLSYAVGKFPGLDFTNSVRTFVEHLEEVF
jgi:hypothetical protein